MSFTELFFFFFPRFYIGSERAVREREMGWFTTRLGRVWVGRVGAFRLDAGYIKIYKIKLRGNAIRGK